MTALPEPGSEDVLYVLDLYCWMHRFYRTMGGRAAHGFIEFVGKILRRQEPAYFAVARDLPWPTFRKELAPTIYKAHREPPDPTLLERMRWAHEMLEDVFGVKVYAHKGFEADDLIAALVKQALADGMRVVIVALDKDLLQLVDGERVFMWDGKWQVWGKPEVEAKFGIRPDQLRDYLAIVGDVSDNVPGVKGAGPKAATRMLSKYGSIDNALEQARIPGAMKHDKDLARLAFNEEALVLSRKLVTLVDDIPIPFQRQELKVA